MKTKYLLFLVILLAMGGSLSAQGIPYQLNPPAPNARVLFCPVPDGGYPCPSPVTVYSDSATTQTVAQPISIGSGGNLSVYFAAGTASWTVQLSGPGYGPTNRYVVAGGSSSSTSNPAPNMGFYLTNACLPANTNQCFNTFADTQVCSNCSWTNASTTITANTARFTSADCAPPGAGCTGTSPSKSVMGFQTCSSDLVSSHASGGEIAPNATPPTIATFIDSTHVTISATPANTQALVTGNPQGGCFVYGHIDDAGMAAVSVAIAAATACPRLFLAAANYFITTPPGFMTSNPAACAAIGPGLGGNFGTTTLPAGFEVEGRGAGATAIYLATNFPNGNACSNRPSPAVTPFQNSGACLVVPVMGGWSHFRIDGGGQNAATALSGKVLGPYLAVGKLVDFTCVNYGGYTGGSSGGIELSLNNWLDRVNNAGCGSEGLIVDSGAQNNVGHNVVIESSSVNSLVITGPSSGNTSFSFTCYWCDFAAADSQPFGAFPVIRNIGGNLKLIGGYIYPGNGNDGANTNNGVIGYSCDTTANCLFFAESVAFAELTGGASNSSGAIKCTVACTNYLLNDILQSQSAGFDIQDVAGSKEFLLGANTLTPRLSIAGQLIADGQSISGACTGVGTAASTLALRISGTSTTGTGIPTTCTSTTLDAGVPMSASRTLMGLTVSVSAAGTNASSGVVTVLKNGSATTLTCTIGTGTSCTDGSHSVAVVAGDLVSIQFTTQAADTLAGVKAFAMWQ